MFFRRERPKKLSFEDHISAVRAAGFSTQPAGGGRVRIERGGVACIAEPGDGGLPRITVRAGLAMGEEIGSLTDEGFQKFFTTPGGKRIPALAEELKAVQDFQEDLRETLGMTSLYNEAMGTVSNLYVYDRVKGRDSGDQPKPWDIG